MDPKRHGEMGFAGMAIAVIVVVGIALYGIAYLNKHGHKSA